MLPSDEWQWFIDQAHGEYDHLVVGSSLPWLMPPAIHYLEAWNERRADSSSPRVAARAEKIRSTFDLVPDVPVSKFVLTLRGGPRGLLVNSRNQCSRRHPRGGGGKRAQASKARGRRKGLRAIVRFKAQNGKKLNLRPRLRAPCGKRSHHSK